MLTYDGLADPACCEKYLKDNKHNSLKLALKICSDICPWTLSVPRSSQFSEQIMSADKYPSIFSRQMKAIVYISVGLGYFSQSTFLLTFKDYFK